MGKSIPDLIWWRNFLRNSNHASEYSLNEPCRRSRGHFFEISVPSFERSELGVRKLLVKFPTRDKSLRWCVVGDNEKKNGQEDRNISAKEFPIDCVILVKRFLEETSNSNWGDTRLAHFPLTPPPLPLLIKSSRSKRRTCLGLLLLPLPSSDRLVECIFVGPTMMAVDGGKMWPISCT